MKIGIFAMLSEKTMDPVSAARRCEELGFESFWVPEHAIIPVQMKVPYPALDGKIPDPYTRFPEDPQRALAEYAEAGVHRLILCPVLDRPNAERVLEQVAKDYLSEV